MKKKKRVLKKWVLNAVLATALIGLYAAAAILGQQAGDSTIIANLCIALWGCILFAIPTGFYFVNGGE